MKEKTTKRVAILNETLDPGMVITTINVLEILTRTPYEKLGKREAGTLRTWFVKSCVRKGYATLLSKKQKSEKGRTPFLYRWNGVKTNQKQAVQKQLSFSKEKSKADSDIITTSQIGESILKYIQELKDYQKLLENEIDTLKTEKGELQQSWDMQQLQVMKLTAHVQDLNKKIALSGGREVSIKEIMNRA
jgi:hypothetical protein